MTMRDPYDVLGLPRSASDSDIKKAFRKLAKRHHPDQNREDPKSAARFAEVNAANEILGDPEKRARFDRGEIDADGRPRASGFAGAGPGSAEDIFRQFDFGGAAGPFGRGRGGADPSDIFGQMFGNAGRGRGIPDGDDLALDLRISLEESVRGASRRVAMPTGRSLDVTVPPGVTAGQTIRLKGQGQPSPFGGKPGDALLTIRIEPHERFTVEGSDLRVRVPVPLEDAVLGGQVRVPTLDGLVEITVPRRSGGGRTLRLKGKGLPTRTGSGDLYVTLDVTLPDDPELDALMERRRARV